MTTATSIAKIATHTAHTALEVRHHQQHRFIQPAAQDAVRFGQQDTGSKPILERPTIDPLPTDRKLNIGQKICLRMIQGYQWASRFPLYYVKKALGYTGKSKGMFPCPYCPNCSRFTFDAIAQFGVVKGIWEGFKRVFLRCNPIALWLKTGKFINETGSVPDPLPKA